MSEAKQGRGPGFWVPIGMMATMLCTVAGGAMYVGSLDTTVGQLVEVQKETRDAVKDNTRAIDAEGRALAVIRSLVDQQGRTQALHGDRLRALEQRVGK